MQDIANQGYISIRAREESALQENQDEVARPPLGETVPLHCPADERTSPGSAHQFFASASLRTSFSTPRSARSLLRRAFSSPGRAGTPCLSCSCRRTWSAGGRGVLTDALLLTERADDLIAPFGFLQDGDDLLVRELFPFHFTFDLYRHICLGSR